MTNKHMQVPQRSGQISRSNTRNYLYGPLPSPWAASEVWINKLGVMCEKGSGEKTGSIQYCCLSEPQFASHDALVCVLSLTVDEAGDPVAFPIHRWEADSWGRCTSETTGMLSQAQRASPTSAPAEPAAGGRPPQHTAQTHFTDARKYCDPV